MENTYKLTLDHDLAITLTFNDFHIGTIEERITHAMYIITCFICIFT